MRQILLLFLTILFCQRNFSQELFEVNGKVVDAKTKLPLSFSNIRVAESTLGTAANKDGQFNLKLKPGNYNLIASYIGYVSDTINIQLNLNATGISFALLETKINLAEVVVTPGINPALEIIRKAIHKKNERKQKILSYEFDSYTKGLIRTEEDIRGGRGSISMSIGSGDSSELKISGILENQSKGFFKKPDNFKEIILARKQSANFPSSINTLTGGRLIQNFYDDDVSFFNRDIPGPIADDALDYYDYYLEEKIGIDTSTVFKIYMRTIKPFDPGFEGYIFIFNHSFQLAKVDFQLNRAANIGGLFDTVNVFQQFSNFDSLSMPVDYRLFIEANYLGLAKLGFELNTILYDYKINHPLDEEIFNKAIITVLPDADKKDSLYWQNITTIPNTSEEEAAYTRIDSLKNLPRDFWEEFSILSSRVQLSDNISVSAPLSMYHFNPVEGNAVDFGFFLDNLLDERFNASMNLSYGFSDKKVKSDFSFRYLLGDYRTTTINFNAFNRLNILFAESDNYNDLTSTLLALLSKYSFRNYFYSKGFSLGISGEVTPILQIGLQFENRHDRSAVNRSDFSFFAKDKSYQVNSAVDDLKMNIITASFKLDPRKYVEDGLYRRRVTMGKFYFTLLGSISYSSPDFLKSEADFKKYELTFFSSINSFGSTKLDLKLYGSYNDGDMPYQLLYSMPGNFDLAFKNFSFRTLKVNEVLSDRVLSLNLEYNFRDELLKIAGIPGVQDWGIQLTTFINAFYSKPGSSTKLNPLFKSAEYLLPFYEAGFSIGHVLVPIQIEFAWKLNHRDGNNFRVGLNAFVF